MQSFLRGVIDLLEMLLDPPRVVLCYSAAEVFSGQILALISFPALLSL